MEKNYRVPELGDTVVCIEIGYFAGDITIRVKRYEVGNKTEKNFVLNLQEKGFRHRKLQANLPNLGIIRSGSTLDYFRAESWVHEDNELEETTRLLKALEAFADKRSMESLAIRDSVKKQVRVHMMIEGVGEK